MSKTRRLRHAATRTIYRRGVYIHGEVIGIFLGLLLLVIVSALTLSPSIHADYDVFNPSTGDVDVNYAIDQNPTFIVDANDLSGKISQTAVTTLAGRDANVTPIVSPIYGTNQFKVTLDPTQQPEAGRYKIAVVIKNGPLVRTVTQDFTWGVLSVNVPKSSYKPHETVPIGMAVLDDNGITLCSADTKVEITAPDGQVTTLTTAQKQIKIADTCKDKSVTAAPDYLANYVPTQTGNYDVRMTTSTIRGTRSLESSFTVADHANFVSERPNTAMRLYPAAPYDVTLKIHANKPFDGSLDEPYPNSFTVTNQRLVVVDAGGQKRQISNKNFRVDVKGDKRYLHWDELSLEVGDTAELTYTYKAPGVSPAFYQIGSAYLTSVRGNKAFQEPRAWQLAGDAVNDVIVLWDTAKGTIPTGWTCVSCVSGDAFYQLFPYIDSTYAGTGGGPESHTHTYTFSSATTGTATGNINTLGGNTAVPTAGHTHTWPAPVIDAADNKPPYQDLEFIKASNPLGLPANAIAMFDVASTASLPTNWSSYTPLNDPSNTGTAGNGKFLRGEGNNNTGGTATHSLVREAVTSGTNTGTVNIVTGTNQTISNTGHTHTLAAGSTATDNNNPLYASVVFGQLSATADKDAIPNGMIAFFDNTTMPTGWTQTTTLGGTTVTGHLIKGTINDTAGTPVGGVSTHNHTGSQVITSSGPSLTRQVAGGGLTNTTSTTSTHTHNVTYTIGSASSMPNYRSVILGKFATVNFTGTVYTDEGTTAQATSVTVKGVVNGVAQRSTTSAVTTGTFTLPMPDPGVGGTVTIWLDTNGGVNGTRVTRSNGGAISGLNIYENRLVVTHEDAGPISNSDIGKCDKNTAAPCGDSDQHYAVSGGNLTVDSDTRLYINGGKTFTPGGAVTLTSGAASSAVGGDVKFGSSTSTFNIGANNLSVGGDWDNTANGIFTKSAGQTTTMTGTGAGFLVSAGTNASDHFEKLVFNGSTSPAWAFNPAATAANIDNDFTITTGSVTAPSAVLAVGGSWSNAGTFTHNSGTVQFTSTATGKTIDPGSSNFNNVTFNGSGGGWSPVTNTMTVLGDLTMTAGTLGAAGDTADIKVNGNAQGTAGVINITASGRTFTQRVTGAKSFGPTTASTNWAFTNLTFSNGNAGATPVTITTNLNSTGGITIGGNMLVGASGDATGATTTLDAGDRIWTLNGTGGNPFQLLASPIAGFTANLSTMFYNGDNPSGTTTVQSTTYYKLVLNNATETWVPSGDITANLRINVNGGTFSVGSRNVTIGSAGVANSGFLNNSTGTGVYSQTSPGTTTILSSSGATGVQIGAAGGVTFYNLSIVPAVATAPAIAFGTSAGQSFTVSNNFTIGNATNPVSVDASTANLTVGGDVTINTTSSSNNTFSAPTSTATFSVGGSWSNVGTGTFTPGTGTVTFNASAAGKTINSGGTAAGKKFNKVAFNSGSGGWTIQTNDLTASSDFALTNISSLTLQSGRTLEVDGTYSVCDSCTSGTTWTGTTLYLNSATNYTVGSKTQNSEVYGTLKVGANTDIRTWNSGATTDTVDATGSLYSQNDSNSAGALKVYGDYHTIGTDYWRYDTDFDGTALAGASKRQVIVQLETGSGRGLTVDSGGTLNVRGGGGGVNQFTSIDRQGASGVYHLTNNGTANVQDAKISNISFDGGTWTILNTIPTTTSVTAGTLNVDWYLNTHLVDRDTPATNIDTAGSDITVSESSSATTVFKEASGSWGSGAVLQTADSNSSGIVPQPDTDGSLRIREYAQGSSSTTYYNYDIAVSNEAQFANYDYQRDYAKYLTSTANSSSTNQKSISSSWYRDTIATAGADGTLNGAVPNGSWYIGMSKGIISFWDTASGSIPSGWSCVSCNSGDAFYQKFFRAASTYGGTGGSDTVSHTLTYSSATGSATFGAQSGSTTVASGSHTHTWGNVTTNSVDIKPPYKDLEVIRGPVSGPLAWPANIIMPFSTATAPSGWTAYTALDGKYLRGAGDNSTGGATTHTNTTNSLVSGVSSGTVNALTCSSGCTAADAPSHTHTLAATATPAGNNTPSYINVRFMQHSNTSAPPLRTFVALFDYTSLPTDYYITSNAAPYQNNLLAGASSSIGGTGGSTTDNETGTMTITSPAENEASVNVTAGSGVTAALATGTHGVTYSIDSQNAMPAYRDVVVSNYIPQAPPQAPTTLAQAKTDDTVISAGQWVNVTSVKFSAQVTSDNVSSQQLQLCVEKKPIGVNFTGTEDSCGTAVTQAPTTTVTASDTITSLSDAQYHWQARVKDAFNNYSPWTTFNNTGLNTTVDFGIDSTPPVTTSATVYDNTNLDTQPFTTDAQQNADGSLTTLSATWSGFDSTISGLNKYQYSVGTTAGANDVKAWTDNGTTTYVRDSSLALQTSQNYYFNVRAVDNAGNTSSIVSSNGQTVTPTLTFNISTDSNPSPPYFVAIGSVDPTTVATGASKVNVTFQTNGVAGGRVYVASANGGLRSNNVSYTIASASGNLDTLSSGFGAQATSATQTSGGPFTYLSPFNGSGNTIGALNTSFQSIFGSSNPVVGGQGSFQLKLKASNITPASNDYSDTLTIVAAGVY